MLRTVLSYSANATIEVVIKLIIMKQINAKTLKEYQGHNQLVLNQLQKNNKFGSNEWLTFLQAKEMGLKIKKGSRGARILKFIEDEDVTKKRSMAVRNYVVFNLDQTQYDVDLVPSK